MGPMLAPWNLLPGWPFVSRDSGHQWIPLKRAIKPLMFLYVSLKKLLNKHSIWDALTCVVTVINCLRVSEAGEPSASQKFIKNGYKENKKKFTLSVPIRYQTHCNNNDNKSVTKCSNKSFFFPFSPLRIHFLIYQSLYMIEVDPF